MIRSPLRAKTNSFGGPQYDFQFPSSESIQNDILDQYHMSNHHILNSTLLHRDNASNVFSDKSAGSSNGIESATYSFANISDNTTSRRFGALGNKRPSQASSWASGASAANQKYPSTLAPRTGAHENLRSASFQARRSESAAFLRRRRSPDLNGQHSISTDACTIPTADNESFQITFESSKSAKSLVSFQKGSKPRRPSSSTNKAIMTQRNPSSLGRASTSNRSTSKLKRSQAIRCKGGLLQFFNKVGSRVKARVCRWRLAVRKKLFTFKSRRLAKKNKQQTTSHLKRANGYVSNIERTMSNASLRKVSEKRPEVCKPGTDDSAPTRNSTGQTQRTVHDQPKTSRTSLRRSPSSIKRAASSLNRANSSANASSDGARLDSLDSNSRPKIVRSDPSMSLNSIIRQPSIVVNNKVIPLSRFNGEMNDFSIKEEDEDEYVIDTDYMRRSDDNISDFSTSSSSSNEEDYKDSLETPLPMTFESHDEKATTASNSWNHYLRAVVAQRILMRIQIHKFQESGEDVVRQQLIDAIITDYDDNSSSHYETDVETDSTPLTALSGSEKCLSRTDTSGGYSNANDSILSLRPFQGALHQNVKRSLTLPMGFRV
ncbi:LADA_0C06744g1_1 [Lachancea dasiensis]|uniref:LADA_0C06744g1_1 n=1 Tax=Lachancea dasiensis TaxID=1072105 RepID=A0A1G4IZ98_9SACH|nr:LADA_0C06744g1_1 [Lachancea dasiensis]